MIFQIVDIGLKKWQSSANSKGFNNRDHSYDSLSQTPLSSCLRFWFYRFIKDFSFRNINWGSVFFSFYFFVFTRLARVSGLKQLECLMRIFQVNYKKSFYQKWTGQVTSWNWDIQKLLGGKMHHFIKEVYQKKKMTI